MIADHPGGDITIPAIFGFGASYKFSPRFLLAGEYQNRKFSDIEFIYGGFEVDDGACYRIGAEYKGSVLLRFGIFSDAVLAVDSDDDEPKSLTGFTGGIGYDVGKVSLDAFAEYSTFTTENEIYLFNSELYKFYEETTKKFRFGLSASYKFK